MKSLALCVPILLFVLAGCGKPSAEELFAGAQEAQKAQNYPLALERYAKVIQEHPHSAVAETSMFIIGTIHQNDTRKFAEAIDAFTRYSNVYPDGAFTPVALFLIDYIYNNDLGNLDSARAAYDRFLARYPQHEMARSAQFELDHLGKPPEDLFPNQVAATEPTKKSDAAKQSGTPSRRK